MTVLECYGLGEVFNIAWQIRKSVFIEEQKVPLEIERDEIDDVSWHILLLNGETPVATGRLFLIEDSKYGIGRVAVTQESRSKGIGNQIMILLLKKAWSIGAETVELHSQKYAEAFYRNLGFVVEGKSYVEAGIEHVSMKIEKPKV